LKNSELLSLLSLLFAAALARADTLPQFDSQRLSQHVKVLSSNEFEGRGPNTPGETKTVAYLIDQFKAAGLKPGGDLVNGMRSWTQDVALGRFKISGPVTLTVNDRKESLPLAQGEQILVRATMTGARRVDFDGGPLVFVGYGISAPERHWDDFKGVDLKGKLAIVLINEPGSDSGAASFGGKAMSYYGHWSYKFEELARRGALGAIIIHEIAPDSYGWHVTKYLNTGLMYDIIRNQAANTHSPMEAWVQRDVVVDLFNRAGLDFESAKRLAQTRDFKPIALPGLTLSARYAVDAQVIHSKNVVALVEGRERPNQTVLYSAHWDHFGIGAPDAKGDTIYHGALDNGTGVAALLELARVYGKQPAAKRSVVFLAVTAEEKGLLGSEYYVTNPIYPLAETAGVINLDGLSPLGPARDFTIFSSTKLDLIDHLIAKARQWNLTYVPDPKPEAGFAFRSDHFSFAKHGVPAIWFSSGHNLEDGGTAAGDAALMAYMSNSYHRPSDEWSAQWQFTGLAHDLEFLYSVGRDLANSSSWPNWSLDSEFYAVRKRSANKRK
jgi:Zn-dependent M28 family amino/carboxypeptidase